MNPQIRIGANFVSCIKRLAKEGSFLPYMIIEHLQLVLLTDDQRHKNRILRCNCDLITWHKCYCIFITIFEWGQNSRFENRIILIISNEYTLISEVARVDMVLIEKTVNE